MVTSVRKRHALELFAGLPAQYGRMGAVMSFGQDPRWRRAMVDALGVGPGDRVLDVACGTGLVTRELVARGCSVIALDQSSQMLDEARRRLPGVEFVQGQAEALPFAEGEFDALSFTYLLRYVDDRVATMRELARVVRPGGRIGMVEFGVPNRAWSRTAWRVYTRVGLPLLGRAASPAWVEVGRFLGPSIERLYAEEPDLAALWRGAGLRDVQLRRMSFGAGVVMHANA